MEYLKQLDTQLFMLINGSHNAFFDPMMYWLSDKLIWIPMYLLIIFLMIRRYKMQGVLMLVFVALSIALCDQTASGLLKNTVQRLRPSHEPSLSGLIYLSKAGPGGLYGFASSHAANVFWFGYFSLFCTRFKIQIFKIRTIPLGISCGI